MSKIFFKKSLLKHEKYIRTSNNSLPSKPAETYSYRNDKQFNNKMPATTKNCEEIVIEKTRLMGTVSNSTEFTKKIIVQHIVDWF